MEVCEVVEDILVIFMESGLVECMEIVSVCEVKSKKWKRKKKKMLLLD